MRILSFCHLIECCFGGRLGILTKSCATPEFKGLQLTTLAAFCYSSLSAEKASRMMKLLVMLALETPTREKEKEKERRSTTTSAKEANLTSNTNDRKTCNSMS